MKFCIGDCAPEELSIEKNTWDADLEADGEFVFNTLKEAKAYCLKEIEYEMAKLRKAKKRIMETK